MGRSPIFARFVRDYLRAGDLYYQQGKLQSAAEMYSKAGQDVQAAQLFERLGAFDEAVESYRRAGDERSAAEALLKAGRSKEAIRHFEEAGAFERAAEVALNAKLVRRAAKLFERARQPLRAVECLEKDGDLDDALRILADESRRVDDDLVMNLRDRKETKRGLDLRRAQILSRLQRFDEAAPLLGDHGLWVPAGEAYERAGALAEAVEAYFAGGASARAAQLLDQAENVPIELRARILKQAGRHDEAGTLFEAAGDTAEAAESLESAGEWVRAARLWEQVAEMQRAAELYARADRWTEAARCFSTAGLLERAGEAFERAESPESAAACYAKAGLILQAARGFAAAKNRKKAAEVLQEVDSEHPDFARATMLLVPLLVRDELFEGALHRLGLISDDATGTGRLAVERQYWEGRCFAGMGRIKEAISAFERVASLRRGYRDVDERLAELHEQRERDDTGTTDTLPVDMRDAVRAAKSEPEIGDVLAGRYRLLKEVGRGGMGRVYKADDLELGEAVAVKTLISSKALDTADQERLLREVQITRRITHPNVVRVYDMGRFGGGIFVTMELLEGESLDRKLKREGALPLAEVHQLGGQILSGLREAHDLRIVHRDLKPSNVFLTGRRAKILDFGIAREEGADINLTMTGEVIGSPKYMSPEQIQGEILDGRSDLYSFGVLLFTAIAGREPFSGKTPSAIAFKQLRDTPPDLYDFRPNLPSTWKTLVERLMAKEPDLRYSSAAEVMEEIDLLPADEIR